MRTTALISGLLSGVLLMTSACSDPAPAERTKPVSVAAPAADSPLTPQTALRAFNLWANNDDVARATGDERLAITWADDGQIGVTAAEFRKAARQGSQLVRYSYGKPTLWVPRFAGYPQWFVVGVTRNGTPGLLALIKRGPRQRFRLSLAVNPAKGVKLPQIETDADGYATAMATRDDSLLIGPSLVASLQAAVAEDGAKSFSSPSIQSGPFTTGLAAERAKEEKKITKKDLIYTSTYTATQLPVFPLKTKDGGCMVLYALSHDLSLARKTDPGPLTVPAAVAHLIAVDPTGKQLRIHSNLQYAAVVPVRQAKKTKNAPKAVVVAAGGGPVRVTVKTT